MMYFGPYTTKTDEAVFSEFGSSMRGLREFDARERLDAYGPNKIAAKETTWRDILWQQFASPFVYLLAFSSIFSFATGQIPDGAIIAGFIIINAGLGFFQEYNSERSLRALRDFVTSVSRVRRNGNEMLIDSTEIVPGDLLIVSTGDIIPADIRLVETNSLAVREESLSGESAPVFKSILPLASAASSIHDAKNIGFAGTTVVEGFAEGIVIATGKKSFMGDVATLAVETERESGFEKGITQFSRLILRMIVTIVVLLFVIHIFLKGGANIGEMVLFSIALAISVVPEALPVVTTIALSKGALSLARNKVVVRRLSAVEDLGSIEVLCTDKTGTITENKLSVAAVRCPDEKRCVEYATLGSSFLGAKKRDANNSFDLALWAKLDDAAREALKDHAYISERPFDPAIKTNSVLFERDGKKILVVRGAPEVVLGISRNIDAQEAERVRLWVSDEGHHGRRTIAIAIKECDFDRAHCADDETHLDFLGVISFSDNLKPTAKQAIDKARALGVQVKILTGDGPEVSRAVGIEVGLLAPSDRVIEGDQFDLMTETEKSQAVVETHVFARLNPKQKYEIIQFLERNSTVGFLGDGINDSPALKLANVALVVEGASDIARESADIVLLNESLMVIMQGIEDGRKIFANIVKYLKITLVSNFGNFYSVAIASFLIPFLPMLPIQLLLLNLVSDFPMIAIATDTVDKSELLKPKSYQAREIVKVAIIFGLVSTTFDLIMFALFYQRGAQVLQTNWFIGSALTELALIYSMRTKLPFWKTRRPSWSLIGLSVGGVALTVAIPFFAWGTSLFKFVTPTMTDMRTILLVVALYFITTEIGKLVYVKIEAMRAQKKLQETY